MLEQLMVFIAYYNSQNTINGYIIINLKIHDDVKKECNKTYIV